MNRGWYVRLSVLGFLCVLAVYCLYPSYYYYFQATPEQRDSNVAFCQALPSWAHCAKLNLGLDLQGGVHLVLGVRVDKALAHRVDRLADVIRDGFHDKNWPIVKIDHVAQASLPDLPAIDIVLENEDHIRDAQAYLRKEFPILDITTNHAVLRATISQQEADLVRDAAVEQSIKTIRNRADKLGVTEPTIARRGDTQILIQLPGVKDPQRAMDIIGRTAQLEFTMVDTKGTAVWRDIAASSLPEGAKFSSSGIGRNRNEEVAIELPEAQAAAVEALLKPTIPDDRQLAFGPARTIAGMDKPGFLQTYLLHARPALTGSYLVNAQVQQNKDLPSDYYVTMTFDPEGAKIFEKLTSDNTGQSMAIVLDGKVTSAPMIQEKIAGGTARITLGRSVDPRAKFQEAKDLALVLKAGALPAPVEIQEKRQVGKTLGQDTVAKGTTAMLIGALAVVIFMALYYRLSGMMANVALVLNILFMLAFLAMIEATLTLPGMAGIVLTIGMAVDANVLIFERIREELRAGRAPRAAIEAGYQKAFGTIFDSNVTTLIAGIVLMQYGSGPVRGFAITLMIGLICSLYTAIVVTRLIYDAMTSRQRLVHLSI